VFKRIASFLLNRSAPTPTTSQRPLDGLRARLRAKGYGEDDIHEIFLESAYHNDARRRDGRPRPFEHDVREILRSRARLRELEANPPATWSQRPLDARREQLRAKGYTEDEVSKTLLKEAQRSDSRYIFSRHLRAG
jgi:hypothetical protein